MKACPASMRHGCYGHANEVKRDVAGRCRAIGNGRVTLASLQAAGLRAFAA